MVCQCCVCATNPAGPLMHDEHEQPSQVLRRGSCTAGDCWFCDDQNCKTTNNPLCACSICQRHRRVDREPEYLTVEPCPAWRWGYCSRCSGKLCFSSDPTIQPVKERLVSTKAQLTIIPATERSNESNPSSPTPEDLNTIEHTVLSSIKVLFGPGASVQRIVLRSQPLHVIIRDLPLNTTEREVYSLFSKPGFQNFRVHRLATSHDGFYKTADVEFDEPMARNAADFLDGVRFRDKRVKLQLSKGPDQMLDVSPVDANLLHISWMTPHAAVTVAYNSVKEAQAMVVVLQNTMIEGRKLRVRLKRFQSRLLRISYPSTIVRISGLPVDVTKKFVRSLARCSYVSLIERRKYDLDLAFSRLRKDIDKVALVPLKEYKWDESKLISGTAAVQVKFRTWEQACRVRDGLARRRMSYLGGKKLNLSLNEPFRYSTVIPSRQYTVQEKIFLSIADKYKQDPLARIQILPMDSTGTTCIEVFGNNKHAVGALKVRVEQLLAGERILVGEDFFASGEGDSFLEAVSHTTGIHFRAEAESCSVRMFGEGSAAREARRALIGKANEPGVLTMQLNPSSVEFFETKGLAILTEMVGKDNITFKGTSSPPIISIRGRADAKHTLRRLNGESKTCINIGINIDFSGMGSECPICFDTVTNPVPLECGHEYCHNCIFHFLTTAPDVRRFPLCCAACKAPLSIPLLRRFLTPTRLTQLLNASFQSYILNNPDKYRHCPTPTCPQLYKVDKSEKYIQPFDCPSCFLSLCPACDRAPHQSITCEEWCRNMNPKLQDELLEQWAKKRKDDVKRCPKCDNLIEKSSGCSHIRCRCGTHICWRCMQTWPSAPEVYTHLKSFHNAS